MLKCYCKSNINSLLKKYKNGPYYFKLKMPKHAGN